MLLFDAHFGRDFGSLSPPSQIVGILTGCVLGMFPLLFLERRTNDAQTEWKDHTGEGTAGGAGGGDK